MGSRLLTLAPLMALLTSVVIARPLTVQDEQEITADFVQSRIKAIESSSDLDEAVRTSLLEVHRDALAQLQKADKAADRAAEADRLAAEAPALLEKIRDELAEPVVEPQPEFPAEATLRDIEQRHEQARADLKTARSRSDELETEEDRRKVLRTAMTEEIAKAQQQLNEVGDSLASSPGMTAEDPTAQAQHVLLLARRHALKETIRAAEREIASFEARRELLPARRLRAQRRVEDGEKLVAALDAIASEQRRLEAEQATAEAQRQAETVDHPEIKAIADENQALAARRTGPEGLAARIDQVNAELVATKERLSSLRSEIRGAGRKLRAAGLTSAMGALLRKHYEELPGLSTLRQTLRRRAKSISDTQYAMIELGEKKDAVRDIDRAVQQVLQTITPESQEDPRELERALKELLESRATLLDAIDGDYTTYLDRLIDLDVATQELIEETESYKAFIEERILWVRSVTGTLVPSPRSMVDASAWLLSPRGWADAGRQIAAAAVRRWTLLAPLTVLVVVLLAVRRQARRQLTWTGTQATRFGTDSFRLTLQALGLTLILAAPLPVLLLSFWLLSTQIPEQASLARAFAWGCGAVGMLLAPFELLRHTIRPDGLGEVHFRWPKDGMALIRRNLRWSVPFIAVGLFVAVAMDHQPNEVWENSLGRTAFILVIGGLAMFGHRVLRPSSPLIETYLRKNPASLVARMRHIWYALIIGGLLLVALLAALGHYYTAIRLGRDIIPTFVLVLVLLIVHSLLLRWLFLARRRIAVELARKRREEAAAQAAEGTSAADAELPVIDADEVDIPAIDAQSRRLFRTAIVFAFFIGVSIIWSDKLPALKALDRVQLLPTVRILEAESRLQPDRVAPVTEPQPAEAIPAEAKPAPAPTGMAPPMTTLAPPSVASSPRSEAESETWLTLADVGLAVIILIITFAATKNLPALLEMVLLQRLQLDAGLRYAISTLTRYTILIVGLGAALVTVGITWSKVQWLAAALTFGLAFGLQEIFANFISGVIILFERVVRIGDIVSIGTIEGRVSRMRMRATTITDWDRRELLIPNKRLITENVTNWTLTDPITRVVFPVGIAYGSDTALARKLLRQVAEEHECVMTDPPPRAMFRSFGDNALNFELRVYLEDRSKWTQLVDELHANIDSAFREAGITIAFPQRDIHINAANPIEVRVVSGQEAPGAPAAHVVKERAAPEAAPAGNPPATRRSQSP